MMAWLAMFALTLSGLLAIPSVSSGAPPLPDPAGHRVCTEKAFPVPQVNVSRIDKAGMPCCPGVGDTCACSCALALTLQSNPAPLLRSHDGAPLMHDLPLLSGRVTRPLLHPPRV